MKLEVLSFPALLASALQFPLGKSDFFEPDTLFLVLVQLAGGYFQFLSAV